MSCQETSFCAILARREATATAMEVEIGLETEVPPRSHPWNLSHPPLPPTSSRPMWLCHMACDLPHATQCAQKKRAMQPQDEAVLARSHHKKAAGVPPVLLPPGWTWSGGDNDLILVHPPPGSLCEGSVSDNSTTKRSRDGHGPSKYKIVTFDRFWQAKHDSYTATHFNDGGVTEHISFHWSSQNTVRTDLCCDTRGV